MLVAATELLLLISINNSTENHLRFVTAAIFM